MQQIPEGKVEDFVNKTDSLIVKQVWNAAIEAAILTYSQWTTEYPSLVIDELNKLKRKS